MTETELNALLAGITPANEAARAAAHAHWASLAKPLGGLGPGAGDAFLGALLSCLAGKTLEELRILPQAQWERIVAFANAAGSLTTAAKGAIPAMPAREQILRLCGE